MASLRTLRLARSPLTRPVRLFSVSARAASEDAGPAVKYNAFRRRDESDDTLRARLLYQSRYRGTLESDLLLSTFASSHLPSMTRPQLETYDAFLLEEDWDIYYWATQDHPSVPPPNDEARAPPPEPANSSPDELARKPAEGEWGPIAGNLRAGYRGVPDRWRDSEVLALLREHVREKSVGEGKGGMAARPKLFGEGTEKD